MKTTKMNKDESGWKDILYTALKLGTELILGTLPKKDERVAALKARVRNPSKLDLGADETGKWVPNPTDVQKANRKQAEDDRETVRRDLRHWGIQINSSFRKEVNGVVHDLAGAAISLAFDVYEWELVRSIRRLATLTGIQPEWGTRTIDKDGEFYHKDPDGNPTVAALMKPAKEKIAEKRAALEAIRTASKASVPMAATAGDGGDDIDVMIAGLKEAPVSEEQRVLESAIGADQNAFEVVESWLLGERTRQKGGNKPAAKPVDRNAEVQATADLLADAGKGVLKSVPEAATSVIVEAGPVTVGEAGVIAGPAITIVTPRPVAEPGALELKDGVVVPVSEDIVDDMSNDADGGAEDGANVAPETEQNAEPTLEEQLAKANEAKAAALLAEDPDALRDTKTRILGLTAAIVERDRIARETAEAAARAEEANAIAAAAEAEAAVELPVSAPAPTTEVDLDFEKLRELAQNGNPQKPKHQGYAQDLMAAVVITKTIDAAEAVNRAKTVGLIK